MLHPFESSHSNIEPAGQLFRLNLVVLSRVEATEFERYIVAKGLQITVYNLLNELSVGDKDKTSGSVWL